MKSVQNTQNGTSKDTNPVGLFATSGTKSFLCSTIICDDKDLKTKLDICAATAECSLIGLHLPDMNTMRTCSIAKLESNVKSLLSKFRDGNVPLHELISSAKALADVCDENMTESELIIVSFFVGVLMIALETSLKENEKHEYYSELSFMAVDVTFRLHPVDQVTLATIRAISIGISISLLQMTGRIPPPACKIEDGLHTWTPIALTEIKALASIAQSVFRMKKDDRRQSETMRSLSSKFQEIRIFSIHPTRRLPDALSKVLRPIFSMSTRFFDEMAYADSKVHIFLPRELEMLWSEVGRRGHQIRISEKRKIFPLMKFEIRGLDAKKRYQMELRFVPSDNVRYKIDPKIKEPVVKTVCNEVKQSRKILHPDKLALGKQWMEGSLDYSHLMLSNKLDSASLNFVKLSPLYKYKPLIKVMDKNSKSSIYSETKNENDKYCKWRLERLARSANGGVIADPEIAAEPQKETKDDGTMNDNMNLLQDQMSQILLEDKIHE